MQMLQKINLATRDVRFYLPQQADWEIISRFTMLDYDFIIENNPDLLFLLQQRIYDYTSEYAQENPINPAQFERSYQFYTDANNESLSNYVLVYRDQYGLIFASEESYQEYFQDN